MAIRGGSFLSSKQPVFSCDGKFLLLCTGCSVSVLSVNTGLRVAELEGHSDLVTSIAVVHGPEDAKSALTHAWTSSLDGTIRLWNFISGTQIKSVSLNRRIFSMVIPDLSKPSSNTTQLLAFLSVEKLESEAQQAEEAEYNGRTILYNLHRQKFVKGHLAKTMAPRDLVVSPRGNFIGMIDQVKLWLWKLPAGAVSSVKDVQVILLHPWQALRVMAFDPSETTVAAGDETGQIYIWRNAGEREFFTGNPVKRKPDELPQAGDDAEAFTTYHWHSQEVTSLSFTSDGAYLLSGGLEGVLVLWQLENGNRQYLPRLAAPLSFISNSPSAALFAIALADNSIKFLNIGTMKMERSIIGIQRPVHFPEKLEWVNVTKLALHRDGRIVIPAANMTLQFYDVFRDHHAFQIQVSPRNFVSTSDESKEAFGQSTLVTHVAFSEDFSVMATVDLRAGEGSAGGGSSLKFWTKTPEKLPYVLHTSVENPHSGDILALAYHPSRHLIVTCSQANDFKMWSQTRKNDGGKQIWRCSSTGSYKEKKMHAAAFSSDGTLLAVAAEECITLWNPASNRLLCDLQHPGSSTEIVGLLAFIPNSPYFVSASYGTRPHLAVWSLSTLSVCWSYKLFVEAITIDLESPHFAVLSRAEKKKKKTKKNNGDAQICLFNPETPIPISAWSFKQGSGGALQFLPASFVPQEEDEQVSTSKLMALNKHREYIIFDPLSEADSKPEPQIAAKAAPASVLSAYETMYGPLQATKTHQEQHPTKLTSKISFTSNKKPWGNLLNAPSHILPPLTRIGEQVLGSLLNEKTR